MVIKKMEFITSIKVEVPESKVAEFVSGYESLEEYTWPEGVITSYLLQDANEKGSFIIMTITGSEEVSKKLRKVTKTPLFDLIQKLDIKPTSNVYNVVKTLDHSKRHVPYYDIK
jgi:hypothetical protein